MKFIFYYDRPKKKMVIKHNGQVHHVRHIQCNVPTWTAVNNQHAMNHIYMTGVGHVKVKDGQATIEAGGGSNP